MKYLQTLALATLLSAACASKPVKEEPAKAFLTYVNTYRMEGAHSAFQQVGQDLASRWREYLTSNANTPTSLEGAVVREAVHDGHRALTLYATKAKSLGCNPASPDFQKGQGELDRIRRECEAALNLALQYKN